MAKSVLRYAGGKSRIANQLVSRFPDFNEYREAFLGGGIVFLTTKESFSDRKYWINDIFSPLVKFWEESKISNTELQVLLFDLKNHTDTLDIDQIKELVNFCKINLYSQDSLEVARNFFFLNRRTFSGTVLKGGVPKEGSRWTHSSINRIKTLEPALKDVRITCMDYKDVIRLKGDNVFLFLDPPYYGIKGLYSHETIDHEELAEELQRTSHKFMLTYNDTSEVRNFYKGFQIEETQLVYGMDNSGGNKCKRGNELLITNY